MTSTFATILALVACSMVIKVADGSTCSPRPLPGDSQTSWEYKVGDTITLSCDVSTRNPATDSLLWQVGSTLIADGPVLPAYKDKYTVNLDVSTNVYSISWFAKAGDSGVYSCMCKTGDSSASPHFNVVVEQVCTARFLNGDWFPNKGWHYHIGDRATLSCDVSPRVPGYNYVYWKIGGSSQVTQDGTVFPAYKDKYTVKLDTSTNIYSISWIVEAGDTGLYSCLCKTENSASTASSASGIFFNFKALPPIDTSTSHCVGKALLGEDTTTVRYYNPGDRITLTCELFARTSSGMDDWSWKKGPHRIPYYWPGDKFSIKDDESTNIYSLSWNAGKDDSGLYYCSCTKGRVQFEVVIRHKPTTTLPPK